MIIYPSPSAVLRQWFRDERGAVLLLTTLSLPMLLALGAFVIDLGRVSAQQTELQSFVDHVALAAAAELDGEADAIARAQTAARTFVAADRQTWARGPNALDASAGGDIAFRFLTGLPADDAAAIGTALVTNIDAEARFVEVTAAPRRLDHFLAPAASAGLRALGFESELPAMTQVTATAVAGSTTWYCDQTPLMFCSPTGADRQGLRAMLTRGKMLALKNGTSFAPGAFGLLDVASDPSGPCGAPNPGADYWRCVVGLVSGGTQCTTDAGTVGIRPGNMAGPTESGLNTRLDIFQTSLKGEKDNPLYAPAPNVIKGLADTGGGKGKSKGKGKGGGGGGDPCLGNNPGPSEDTMALPRDTCFYTDSCPDGRFGTGDWDDDAYIDMNHDGLAPPGYSRGGTRYELYLAEIAAAAGGDLLDGKSETGRPMCSSQMSSDPSRRVLTVAAIDCVGENVRGNASGVPVLDYYNVFLTEAAGLSGNGDIWVEVIGPAGEDLGGGVGPGFVRDVVQLYR